MERSIEMKIFFTCEVRIPFAELILLLYLKYNTSIIMYFLLQQCTSGGHESGLYGSYWSEVEASCALTHISLLLGPVPGIHVMYYAKRILHSIVRWVILYKDFILV